MLYRKALRKVATNKRSLSLARICSAKEPFSYSISIVDKIDSLVSFIINEKPISSKDPFALRRSVIGLSRIIIEKSSIRLRDLINYSVRFTKNRVLIYKIKMLKLNYSNF